MSQLKEIEGRYYQEAEVQMLATNDKSNIIDVFGELKYFKVPDGTYESENKHLYILSDDEIKEGDWVIANYFDEKYYVVQANNILLGNVEHGEALLFSAGGFTHEIGFCKKIIATTDINLLYTRERTARGKFDNLTFEKGWNKANFKPTYLARLSDSFIKKFIKEYNQGNQITKVLVEYDKDWKQITGYNTVHQLDNILKVDSNNQITIKKVEPELYTREQVEMLIRYAMQSKGYTPEYEFRKFIKENL